jgi:hypothetical protein
MPVVKLTKEELNEALSVGMNRHKVNRSAGRYDNKVLADGINVDIQGAIGELVVSKYLGLPWDGRLKNNSEWLQWRKTGHDVSGFEVRFTKHRNGRLILHNKDKDMSIFILVTQINEGTYEIAGWCLGREGKNPAYWQDVGYGRPCYFVPREKMRKIEAIKAVVDKSKLEASA